MESIVLLQLFLPELPNMIICKQNKLQIIIEVNYNKMFVLLISNKLKIIQDAC
jgi:hypothetical protein